MSIFVTPRATPYMRAGLFRPDYADALVDLFGRQNIVGYWPLSDQSGSIAHEYTGKLTTGVYSNVSLGQPGIGDGRTSGLYNGSTSFCNIYSAALAAAFNNQNGTIIIWPKITAAVWGDSTVRRFFNIEADGSNRISASKLTAANQFSMTYLAGGVSKTVTVTTSGPTIFFSCALTWDVINNAVKVYFNGIQSGITQTGLGTWAGALAATLTVIGATSTVPAVVMSGSLAHAILLNRTATAAEIKMAYQMMA
jgi:hypothetical protein